MKKVFLVTKMKTSNLGNEALSKELIKLFVEKVGKENLYVEGRPLGLYAYSMESLESSKTPEVLFDSWADAVIKKYRTLNVDRPFVAKVNDFKLTRLTAMKFEGIKTFLRPVKRLLKRVSLFDKTYANRLAAINSCDVFIYSGAGEVTDNHVFLRQLLELRIAQKLGKQTGAVNQSLVVRTEMFKKIVNLVYGKMDQIVVRGAISKANIASFGVNDKIIHIAPDTAIRTTPDSFLNKNKGTVGINFTPFIKYEWSDVAAVVNKLKACNKKIIFVTNEPLGDLQIIEKFKTDFDIDVLEECNDYKDFAKHLSSLEYIVSARLHTNVMALAVNVPVIAIEGRVFKTKELIEQFEYPLPTVNVDEPGWANTLIGLIDIIESGKIDFTAYFRDILVRHKEEVKYNASWINNN